MKGALEVERLFLRELCEGNLEGSSFAADPERYGEEGSEDWHLSLWGPPWGAW